MEASKTFKPALGRRAGLVPSLDSCPGSPTASRYALWPPGRDGARQRFVMQSRYEQDMGEFIRPVSTLILSFLGLLAHSLAQFWHGTISSPHHLLRRPGGRDPLGDGLMDTGHTCIVDRRSACECGLCSCYTGRSYSARVAGGRSERMSEPRCGAQLDTDPSPVRAQEQRP